MTFHWACLVPLTHWTRHLLNTIGDILVYGNSKAIALFVLLDFVRVVHKKQSVLLSGLSGIGSK